MPELPEVETTRQGILPHIRKQRVSAVVIRQPNLRWPVSAELPEALVGSIIEDVSRRGKYLLLATPRGTLLVHLGMSGSLRILLNDLPPGKHDHVDIGFAHGPVLRFTDPRRFGCLLWVAGPRHPLLDSLGPEPLGEAFTGDYLCQLSRGRKLPVKSFIMDSRIVVGVGNIYANEALFMAGIHPRRGAGRISAARYARLVTAIKAVLAGAIRAGGTTLRDFTDSSGKPGYFRQSLQVYGRATLPCHRCGSPLRDARLAGRSTVYCHICQR